MTTAEVLRDARALYAANPSHAGSGTDPDPGTHCVIYAVNTAAAEDGPFDSAISAFTSAIDSSDCLVNWNAEHTTEEVLAAFDRAIKAAA